MALRICTWLWRGVVALVFLVAAWSKWNAGIEYLEPTTVYDRFVAGSPMRHYAILAAEILAALWLLTGLKPRWSAMYAGLILTAFTVMLAIEISSANPVVCGCGIRQVLPGGDPRVDLAIGIGRNLVLLLGCGWLWLFGEEPAKPMAEPPSPSA